MRASLARDLARWEWGVLSAADLVLRHRGRAAGLVAMYQRLADLGGAPVPDPEAGWERLRERLPEHRVAVRPMGPAFSLRRLMARPLALAAALVLFGAAVGYAAAPEAVNRRLANVWERVEDFFRDEPSEDRPTRSPGGERPGVAPSLSDDEDGDEGHGRPGEDGDDREDRDDDREGPSEDSDEGSDDDSGEGPDGDREGPADDSGEGSDDDSGEGEEGDESDEAQEPDAPDD